MTKAETKPVLANETLKQVFARNIGAALEKRGLTNNAEVVRQTKRFGVDMTATTVGRTKLGLHAPRLDTVEALARVTGFEPWQLLIPWFDPSNPPIIPALTEEERALYKRLFGNDKPPP